MKRYMLCFATGLALVMAGCGDIGDRTADYDDENQATEPGDVEDGEVAVGKEITLEGDVTHVYDAHAFRLSDKGIDLEKDLIVVTKDPLPFTAEDDAVVAVTGKVAKFATIEVEKEYGLDFDPEVEIELEDVEYYLADASITVKQTADE